MVKIHPEDDRTILQHQCGLTTLVARPTARADQVSAAELIAVVALFSEKIARHAMLSRSSARWRVGAISGQKDVA